MTECSVFVTEGKESALLLGNPTLAAKRVAVRVQLEKATPGSKAKVVSADGKVVGTHEVSGGTGRGGQTRPSARFALPPGKYKVEIRNSAGQTKEKEITVTDQPIRLAFD